MSDPMHWPQKVATRGSAGSVTFEAHAPWCPVEQARAAMGGELVGFSTELLPQCDCVPGYRLNGVRIGCFPPPKVKIDAP